MVGIMSNAKPWEDESLQGEYHRTKAFLAKKKADKEKKEGGLSGLTDALGQAGKFEKRNRLIDQATKRLRKAMPGQEE